MMSRASFDRSRLGVCTGGPEPSQVVAVVEFLHAQSSNANTPGETWKWLASLPIWERFNIRLPLRAMAGDSRVQHLADTTSPLIDETHPIPATFEVVSMSATTSLLTLPASRSVAPSVSPFDQPSHLTAHSPRRPSPQSPALTESVQGVLNLFRRITAWRMLTVVLVAGQWRQTC